MRSDIPEICLQRLPVYLNYLKALPDREGYISSGAIAKALEMGEVLVRKDLAYTSATGRTRVGYKTCELISAIEEYLGCNDNKNAVIFGMGGLGRAVFAYGGFKNYGITLAGAFDTDPRKLGEIDGKPVMDVTDAERGIRELDAKLAIICVPAGKAQEVADLSVKCGIKAILNFAPVLLHVPDGISVRHIDVAANLAILSSMI